MKCFSRIVEHRLPAYSGAVKTIRNRKMWSVYKPCFRTTIRTQILINYF